MIIFRGYSRIISGKISYISLFLTGHFLLFLVSLLMFLLSGTELSIYQIIAAHLVLIGLTIMGLFYKLESFNSSDNKDLFI